MNDFINQKKNELIEYLKKYLSRDGYWYKSDRDEVNKIAESFLLQAHNNALEELMAGKNPDYWPPKKRNKIKSLKS